jgi:hypothetical protein
MRIESLTYNVNWRKFRVGYSFFIPCIDCDKAKKSIQAIAKKQKSNIVMKVVIEEGVRGIRVWRV